MILSEAFKYMSAVETLLCSVVCKEWLTIARSDQVWKSHIIRDFIKHVPKKETYPPKGRIYNLNDVRYMRSYKLIGEPPVFVEYWNLLSELTPLVYEERFILQVK